MGHLDQFDGALDMKDFKLISMVGCIYKVIAKVLARRIKFVMNNLVGEAQTTFLQYKQIYDGVLIACESVQWLKKIEKEGVDCET